MSDSGQRPSKLDTDESDPSGAQKLLESIQLKVTQALPKQPSKKDDETEENEKIEMMQDLKQVLLREAEAVAKLTEDKMRKRQLMIAKTCDV